MLVHQAVDPTETQEKQRREQATSYSCDPRELKENRRGSTQMEFLHS